QTINKGKTSYSPNSLGGGCPFQAGQMQGGFTSHEEKIDAHKIRERSDSFFDHFSQATLFFNSQSDFEKDHIVSALSFELGKLKTPAIRERMLHTLTYVDKGLASKVATALGLKITDRSKPVNEGVPADADPKRYQPVIKKSSIPVSPALSMANTIKDSIKTRKIAVLAADGVNAQSLNMVKNALLAQKAVVEIIAPHQGNIMSMDKKAIPVDQSFLTAASVLYDAVYIPGGKNSIAALKAEPDALHFLNEAFKHCKAIAADAEAMPVLEATNFSDRLADHKGQPGGLLTGTDAKKLATQFIKAVAQHRFWEREKARKVPA
ncbi:MAG: catalase-related domain-containing protein, partial [Ferruginibacter sp.]